MVAIDIFRGRVPAPAPAPALDPRQQTLQSVRARRVAVPPIAPQQFNIDTGPATPVSIEPAGLAEEVEQSPALMVVVRETPGDNRKRDQVDVSEASVDADITGDEPQVVVDDRCRGAARAEGGRGATSAA